MKRRITADPRAVPNSCRPPAGEMGRMLTVRIDDLRVDDRYQRRISQNSVRNVRRIASDFDWSRFTPLIVVPSDSEPGAYDVIDGQHRATAALTIGLTEVPCYVLTGCDLAEAARSFAAINANVTRVRPVDVWAARLAAGEPEALALKRVLDAADVVVIDKKDGWEVGETASVSVLERSLVRNGADLLITALQCLTQTGDGNPGTLTGSYVNATVEALRRKRDLAERPSAIFEALDVFSFAEAGERARQECAVTKNAPQFVITRLINERLAAAGIR